MPRRWIIFVFAVGLSCCALAGHAVAQGEKKIEQLKTAGEFAADTPKDKLKTECPSKLFALECVGGRTYTIDLRSEDFDAWLRLEDPSGKTIKEDDDTGGGVKGTDARIVFKAEMAGTYTIAAT